MAAEIVKVALKNLHANPYRDIENYPISRKKVDSLKESYKTVDLWPSIIARKVKSGYEIAFGHHRRAAAIELWGEDQEVDVIVMDLDNDQMLVMMANENSEDWGSNFFLATMQPIAATVKAFADGEIKLDTVGPRGSSGNRIAPSFTDRPVAEHLPNKEKTRIKLDSDAFVYNPRSVARKLGWIEYNEGHAQKAKKLGHKDWKEYGIQANKRVLLAFNALELIEKSALNAAGLQGLGSEYAQVIIRASRNAFDKKSSELADKEAKKEEKRLKKEAKLEAERKAAEREYKKAVKLKGEREAKVQHEALKAHEKAIADQLKADEKARAKTVEEAAEEAAEAATEKFESLVERVHNNEITTRGIIEETQDARTAVSVGEKSRVGVDLSFKVTALAEKLAAQSVPATLTSLVEALYDPANACPIKDVRKLAQAIADKSSDMSQLKAKINKAIRRRTR